MYTLGWLHIAMVYCALQSLISTWQVTGHAAMQQHVGRRR